MPKILHFTFFKFWTPFLKGRAYTFSTSQPPQSDTFLHVAFFYSQTCFKHLFFTAQEFPISFRRHSDIIPKAHDYENKQKIVPKKYTNQLDKIIWLIASKRGFWMWILSIEQILLLDSPQYFRPFLNQYNRFTIDWYFDYMWKP